MATSNLEFAAVVDAWCKKSEDRLTRVFRESVQRIIAIMQTPVDAGGNMPIITGFLRASLQASTEGPAPLSRANPGSVTQTYDDGSIAVVIAGAELGATIWASYTANYAGHAEYGTDRMQGHGFVRLAALQWQHTVSQVVSEAKSLAG